MPAHLPLCLVCVNSPILRFTPSKPVSLVGRDDSCDLVVADPSVSRRHAELHLSDGSLEVVDLGSRNGTFVDGQRISSRTVEPGQVIRFGKAGFHVRERAPEFDTDDPSATDNAAGTVNRPVSDLSEAQQRGFRELMQGLSEKAIAELLILSPNTIHNHIRAIYKHFGVHSRDELILLVRGVPNDPEKK